MVRAVTRRLHLGLLASLLPLALGGCGGEGSSGTIYGSGGTTLPSGVTTDMSDTDSSGSTVGEGDSDTDESAGDGDGDSGGTIFDVGDNGTDTDATDTDGEGCMLPHTPCDAGSDDPFAVIGLGCPGETPINPSIDAHPDGLAVRTGFGGTDTYAPREGESFFVLSTGHTVELDDEPTSPGDQINHCNKWFTPGDGMDTTNFPPPIQKTNVGGDCLANPALVGTGDCSNTIAAQFNQSGWKYDYQEIRVSLTVPESANALAFDVAYFTTEWPVFAGQPYNDMFIAWLEASNWTGNVSFDDFGSALSLNAAFFEYEDQGGNLAEFAGTCMRYGAGTPWLSSTAPVVPGDQIELVFAIFDLDDVNLDSFVFLDNFRWLCEGEGPPSTVPVPIP